MPEGGADLVQATFRLPLRRGLCGRGSWNHPQLLHHRHHVHVLPLAHDLVVADGKDGADVEAHLTTGRSDSHKIALVGAAAGELHDGGVTRAMNMPKVDAAVRKGGGKHLTNGQPRFRASLRLSVSSRVG